MNKNIKGFYVKNCSLSAISTGEHVGSLMELKNKLTTIDEACIYHHFWGWRLRSQLLHTQYYNDFALWAYHHLHDQTLAEKLNFVDPLKLNYLEALRQEVIDILEQRLDDQKLLAWMLHEDRFHFIKSKLTIFQSKYVIEKPENLPYILSSLPLCSIFYHFIDARIRNNEKMDDFSLWLLSHNEKYDDLINALQNIAPLFLSLTALKEQLINVTQSFFKGVGK